MGTINGNRLRDLVKRVVGFGDASSDDTAVDKILLRPCAKWVVSGADIDAANQAYRFVLDPSLDQRTFIESVTVVCSATAAANGTNYKTITLVNNDGAAGSDTTIGTVDTSATGFTAKVGRTMTLTAANQVVAAGQQLEVAVAVAGTGVALTGLSVIVKGYPI